MIKKLLFLFVIVMCATLTMNAQNLLLNGDFEAGTGDNFTNWSKWNGATSMTAESVEIHGGSRALKAISTGVAGEQWKVELHSDAVATVIGSSYEVSMWVKGATAGNVVRFSTSGGTTVYGPDFTVSTAWQKCYLTFTATATSTNINLDLGGNAATVNTFYVDDVAMIDITATSKDFILNGNLEAGTGDSFTNWGKWNGGANMTAETVNVHGGVRGLKAVSTGAAEYNVQLVSDPMTLEVGRNYTASMWVKAVTGGNTIRFSTTATAGANYGPSTTIGTTWQQVTYSFAAKDASTRLNLDLGKSTDTFYIDDITFIGASPVLSAEKFEVSNKIVFYPNPVTDNLNISSDAAIKSVIVIDLNGKTVKTVKSVNNIQSVNLSELSQGMYILSTDTNQQFKFLKN
jgi:hypothetical protein